MQVRLVSSLRNKYFKSVGENDAWDERPEGADARLTGINEGPPVAELLEHPHHQCLLFFHLLAVRRHLDILLPAGALYGLQVARQITRISTLVICRTLRDECKSMNHIPNKGRGATSRVVGVEGSRVTDLDEVGVVELEADGTL